MEEEEEEERSIGMAMEEFVGGRDSNSSSRGTSENSNGK